MGGNFFHGFATGAIVSGLNHGLNHVSENIFNGGSRTRNNASKANKTQSSMSLTKKLYDHYKSGAGGKFNHYP